ncbi:MAG: hypothetical protein HQ507_01100 [Candidatus Marinimicrobia bacterium]|nr:hypothetical protein [Candidatus Neomarinimicrobiota bacterium]
MKNKVKPDYQIIQNDEIDLKALWNVLWTNKLNLSYITAVFFGLGIIYLIFSTTLYYSNALMIPEDSDGSTSMTSMLSLASSFGMDMGAPASEGPTINMVDYVTSRRLQDLILEKTWMNKNGETINLFQQWDIGDTTGMLYGLKTSLKSVLNSEVKTAEEIRLQMLYAGRGILLERISAKKTETGLLMIEVWMEDPLIAKNMVTFIIDSMLDFIKEVKVARSKINREFLVKRMADVGFELKEAEQNMTDFQKDNRRVADSPELVIELANLRRDVEIKTQLYIMLQNEYELARIEETKDMGGLEVLDEAFYPVEPGKPQKALVLLLSVFVGAIIAVPGYLIYRGIKLQRAD